MHWGSRTVDARLGELNVQISPNVTTTLIVVPTGGVAVTGMSLWIGGTGSGGDLTGASELPFTQDGGEWTVVLPPFPSGVWLPLRLEINDFVVTVGYLCVDETLSNGGADQTLGLTLGGREFTIVINGLVGAGAEGGIIGFDAGGDASAARPDVPSTTIVLWTNVPSEPINMGPFDMWEDTA